MEWDGQTVLGIVLDWYLLHTSLPTSCCFSFLPHCRPSWDTSHLRTCHCDHTPSPAHTSTQRYAICSMGVFASEPREAICGCCSHSAGRNVCTSIVTAKQPKSEIFCHHFQPSGKGYHSSFMLCTLLPLLFTTVPSFYVLLPQPPTLFYPTL